ncbi:MAG: PiT family inorganic phosphate transporter [Planctomycetes bacterium]|nr:PiT family inorganic phosphate transporter [Planctomycetota bacterium]
MTTLLIAIILLALIFDYINGFHDAANSIATIVSTKVLTPFQAVLWAAIFNFAAYWIFQDHAVANTISKTVHKEFITLHVIFSGLIAAIIWNLLTWWYGIPSSSSHTLIGGFAGAAITHAIFEKGNISWGAIVESDTILKTVLFIFLAPLIGMIISVFITIVTVMRNIWIRMGIIVATTLLTLFLFDQFEESKMDTGLKKFLKLDKYTEEVKSARTSLASNPNDETAADKLESAEKKFNKAENAYKQLAPLVENFDALGADSIARYAYQNGLLTDIEISKLKDDARNANNYLVMEALSIEKPETKPVFDLAKTETEKYKQPLKLYLEKKIDLDSALRAMNAIYPILPQYNDKVRKKIESFSIQRSFEKEILKSENRTIEWGIIFTAILFMLIYLYVEKVKSPTAYTMANMFKKLQLYSSAAFSIGHGGNDAQKVMGIIGAALIASGQIQDFSQLPNWVPIACYLAIGLGTMSGGWKIVKTMGTKITKVTPLEGVAAETSGALTLFFTGQMGIPVSTTHTITGSIMGVGATKRLSAVRWGVTLNLVWAWILTIPISALLAGGIYALVRLF